MSRYLVFYSILVVFLGSILHATLCATVPEYECHDCECCKNAPLKPVCERHGRQFKSACYATYCAKVEIECHTSCPCKKNCPQCETISADPVCGINNETYSNKCRANCNSISIDCEHPCPCWG